MIFQARKLMAVLAAASMVLVLTHAGGTFGAPAYADSDLQAQFSVFFAHNGWTEQLPDNRKISRTGDYPSAFRAGLTGQPAGMSGTVLYSVNVSGTGWTARAENGATAGKEIPEGAPLESIKVWLNGDLAKNYDICTRVMVDGAWQDWVRNGQEAGQAGVGKHLDGICVSVVKKGETPGDSSEQVEAGTPAAAGTASGTASGTGTADASKPMVALTFDDGPSSYDARTLAALEAVGGHATFFMVGNRVAAHADIVQRMVADGCELGNHSFAHQDLAKLSSDAIQQTIAQTNDALMSVAGQPASVIRPPYGAVGGAVKPTLAAMGYAAILWHIDTLDWKTRNTANTVKVVLDQVQDGDIVLMHSIYEPSAAAAEQIIPELVNRGYQLVTVSELANARGGMTPGVGYGRFRP